MSKLQDYLEMASKKPKKPSKYTEYEDAIIKIGSQIKEDFDDNWSEADIRLGIRQVIGLLQMSDKELIDFFREHVSESVKTIADVKQEIEVALRNELEGY